MSAILTASSFDINFAGVSCDIAGATASTTTIAIRQKIIRRVIVNYDGDREQEGGKSYERALFRRERSFFVRIVAFCLVLAGAFDMLDRMDQVSVRNHGMLGRFFKFSGRVVLGGAPLVLGRMLQKFGSFQVMIDALLRHMFRVANGTFRLEQVTAFSASRTTASFLIPGCIAWEAQPNDHIV